MTSPPSILVTGTIDRPDIIAILRDARSQARFTFLEYSFHHGSRSHPEYYAGYGPLRFWNEFRHANALLDEIRPDKIVFFYVNSLNQVALNLVARQRGIRTYHLEHGFRQRYEETVEGEVEQKQSRKARFDPLKLQREFRDIAGNHAFFARSVLGLEGTKRRALARFGYEIYVHGPSTHVLRRYAAIRQPDRYVSFSPECFEFHRVQDDLTAADMARVEHVGLPQFDHLAALPQAKVDPRNVVLVDHSLHQHGIYGWTPEFRTTWVRKIYDIIRQLDLKLWVKQHPFDSSAAWAPYLDSGHVEVVDSERLAAIIPSTGMVLGLYSTMQLPLAAMAHVAFITLEIHPRPPRLYASQPFIDAGVAAAATDFDQLSAMMARRDHLLEVQVPAKPAFIRQFLHRMDGESGARLRDAILHG